MKIKLTLFTFIMTLLSGCSSESAKDSTANNNFQMNAESAENNIENNTTDLTESDKTVKNDNIKSKYYNKILSFLNTEAQKTFSHYYELIDFKISDYNETIVGENTEALMNYKIIYKNYDKDPNTVNYIKSAKENNDPNYKKLYDEYLDPKEMNMEIKAVINKNNDILLYTDYDPTEKREWVEFKMSDCLIKEEN